ncbi:hypothetical protein [Nocardia sp. NPDC051981]|uniref:hypothetical protein n=1 Tax=Nocardia sp. NPDC051981 TaxID=3155417 RepID=UPI003433FB81
MIEIQNNVLASMAPRTALPADPYLLLNIQLGKLIPLKLRPQPTDAMSHIGVPITGRVRGAFDQIRALTWYYIRCQSPPSSHAVSEPQDSLLQNPVS